jgi:conjugative relaxase-like TrwC/TraI family protein
MHSIASVRSASGAAKYFTKDDFVSGEYYTDEKAGDVSMWGGEGAAAAGLTGTVAQEAFAKALNGELPSGERVVDDKGSRRPGYDLTFSAPKSVSVMAYIAGDKRILGPDGAQTKAVQQTMAWVEKNLAETRVTKDGKTEAVKTGNLVYALFQHDTSRALDPQAHIHAIVANMTKGPDGKLHALHADRIWSSNSVIGSIYHSFLRDELEKLGYQVQMTGKHGTFEIAGVPKAVLETFSQRREQIMEKAAELGIVSPEGRNKITVNTRDPKLTVEDRDGLVLDWMKKAAEQGFDGKKLLEGALQNAAKLEQRENAGPIGRSYTVIADAVKVAMDTVSGLLRSPDPLVDRGFVRLAQSTGQANAQLAVASAVRSLNQREAAFDKDKVAKKALDFGLKGVTIDHVEARVEQLIEKGKLLSGQITHQGQKVDAVTTPEALRTEESILAQVQAGKDAGGPIVAPSEAPDRLQAASPHPLNEGQLAAATLIVSTSDRIVAVQGIAGAGKSTMLQAVARVVEAEGKSVLGLAFQNKMVADMKEGMARPDATPSCEMSVDQMHDSGVKADTIAHFIWHNEKHVTNPNTPDAQARRDELKDTIIVVDETSMVSNRDMLKMLTIAEALGIEKIALIGDRQQLLPIDAGKAFAMMQADKIGMARMDDNLRQQTDQLRTVAALANIGKAGQAMKVLGDKVVEHEDPSAHASDLWLALSPDERANTAIFASGRETRAAINQAVQKGLKDKGTLKGDGLTIAVIQNVNIEREDLRYAKTYEKGQRLEIKGSVPELKLERSVAEVRRTFANGKVEIVKNGKSIKFSPQKIDPMIDKDRMSLATIETIQIHEGDRIRWTDNDKERGIYNASLATIAGIENGKVTVELANKDQVTLEKNDPMIQRMDLAYALNMHMAQGITVNKAITVMQSFERNLSNQRLFNVGVTRIRLDLTMVVDNQQKLELQLDKNPGDKTSSLESLGRLDIDGAAVQTKAADDALTKAMESLDEASSEKILIDPASLDITDLPPMGASTTDYSDIKNLDGEMPSIKDGQDPDRRDVQADRKDDELGMPPLDMDDLSALPAMLKSGEQIRGLPEKNLSLDM